MSAIGYPPFLIQFRHNLEVHPVDARDKRGGHEDDRYDGENLDDLVLLDVHVTEEGCPAGSPDDRS